MPWPAAGTIVSASSSTEACLPPARAGAGRPAPAAWRRRSRASCTLSSRVCTLPRSTVTLQVRPRVQHLRLPAHRAGADRGRPAAGRRSGSAGSARPQRRARGSARRAHPRASACRRARCRAAARFPGPSGCARRNRCGRRAAPRGFPWRTAPCRRYRRGCRSCTVSPVVRDDVFLERRPCCAAPGRTRRSMARKARVCTSASGEPRVPTRSGRRGRAMHRGAWVSPRLRRGGGVERLGSSCDYS